MLPVGLLFWTTELQGAVQGPALGWGVARAMMAGAWLPKSRPHRWETAVREEKQSSFPSPVGSRGMISSLEGWEGTDGVF